MKYLCKNCENIVCLDQIVISKCEICEKNIYSPNIPAYTICDNCLDDLADNGTIVCRQCGEIISDNSQNLCLKDKSRAVRRKASIYAQIRKEKLQRNIKNSKKKEAEFKKVKLSKKDASLSEKCDFDELNCEVN